MKQWRKGIKIKFHSLFAEGNKQDSDRTKDPSLGHHPGLSLHTSQRAQVSGRKESLGACVAGAMGDSQAWVQPVRQGSRLYIPSQHAVDTDENDADITAHCKRMT